MVAAGKVMKSTSSIREAEAVRAGGNAATSTPPQPAPRGPRVLQLAGRVGTKLRLGPAPSWRLAVPPLAGIAIAFAICFILITADGLLARKTPSDAGRFFVWVVSALMVYGLFRALTEKGAWRDLWTAGTITLTSLLAWLDPTPTTFVNTLSFMAALTVFVFGFAPATRIVLAPLAIVTFMGGLAWLIGDLAFGGPAILALTFVAIFAIWFALPYASGWRGVPFLFLVSLWVAITVAFAVVILTSLVVDGVTISNGESMNYSGGILGTLAALVAASIPPVALWFIWQSRRLQQFTLPSVPVRSPVIEMRRNA